ncbi:cation-transporting ATPase [Verticillium dahliae VdLs.17]|uniref:Cation-transporting ATPase n=1 Tax=Verticillium dahliae (strain VdLs.17 / ATCC MYA-4575 / FGSC 10137) TaxID=498257 RepID=G2XDM6_VERDV|nr:cation-transporting ATPase [Verticillium dahliae VdLs.17]EGY17094.1 cation-transporting ATPase [Verticillium dahliae VdLs.17]
MLNESSHRVVMITGDNPLTAVYVARDVEIVDREVLILDAPEDNDDGDKLVWRSVDDKISIPVDPTKPIDPEIIKTKDLCVTGYALAKFKGQQAWFSILRHTWVYARVSPKQKEDILLGLKEMGYYTLMAGDGTNDVGALKQAHIGVALLNGTQEDLVRIAEHSRNTRMKDIYQKQVEMMKRFNQPAPPVPVLIAHMYPPGPSNPNFNKAVEREAQKKNVSPEEYVKAQGYDVETITSPAAQQLINSDPKNRNAQAQKKAANLADRMTTSLMENELDDNEPPTLKLGDASVAAPFTSKLRNVIAVPNIIRQGRCTLVATIQMYKILALNCRVLASLLNSAVYLLQLIQQISTFAINYQGRPFRESLSENRGMFWGILGVSALAFSCAMELAPEINEQMKLVPFTDEFKTTMTSVMVFDYAACWTIEVVLKRLFSDFRPRDIADRRPDQLEREKVRKAEAIQKLIAEQEKAEEEKIAALEKQIADRRQQVANWRRGGPAQ